MDRSRLAIVIPAYNEASTVAAVIDAVHCYGHPIVIDDGSTDDTAGLASAAGARVVSHQTNRGYDAALNTGFAVAAAEGFEFVLTLDADGQHQPDLVEDFVEALTHGATLVVGCRSQLQRLAERLFALYTGRRFGIHDPLCGLKAYDMSLYRALGHFDAYSSIGTELMLFGLRNGAKVEVIPFTALERKGMPRFGQGFAPNIRILRSLAIGIITHCTKRSAAATP